MKPLVYLFFLIALTVRVSAAEVPHIVLVMSDDQGWGQVGYMNHPLLKTPNIDAMAENGLRFNRFYAGASNCSPTRSTVMTGRTNDRTGVFNHGFPMRLQEKTIAQALKNAGYATAHFGKWHLNGLRGPGVPILGSDTHSPGAFGFDYWLSVTNFFDRNPLMSRQGEFEEFKGDSSEIVVGEALKYLRQRVDDDNKAPVFIVIWFGSPHDPMVASEKDMAPFPEALPKDYRNQLGELVAMDRSIGTLRKGLRDFGIADNTLVWYCSDNGGLPQFPKETVGGLRGSKNTMFEGGLRVPCVIEWPSHISEGRITDFPAGTFDIFPTIADITGLPDTDILQPLDGISILPVIDGNEPESREKPLAFRHDGRGVIIEGDWKYLALDDGEHLYNLADDQNETTDLASENPEVLQKLRQNFEEWNQTVMDSVDGRDYSDGVVDANQPERRMWPDDKAYAPYIEGWRKRPEYAGFLERLDKNKSKRLGNEVKGGKKKKN